jgi:hypothetical protein
MTYFYVVQQDTNLYQKYVNFQNSQAIATSKESFSVAGWTKSVGSCAQCIFANVTNSAQTTLLITNIFIINSSNNAILKTYSVPLTNQGVNPSAMSAINSTRPYTFGWTYIIRVVSSNGNTAQAMYPSPNGQTDTAIAQALVSNGLGSISMVFKQFYMYKVITSPCCSDDINHKYNGSLAPCCGSTPVAFSVNVANLDPNQAVINLGANTILWGSISCSKGCGSQSSPTWYIGNVQANGQIQTSYSPITLGYNQTTTLWFVSNCPLSSCTYSSSSTVIVSATFNYAAFLLLAGTYSVYGVSSAYGQNLPFQSVLFSDNIAVVSNSPGSVSSGTTGQSFTLTVNNTALTPSGDGINQVVMTVDPAFTNVAGSKLAGWTVSVSGNVITWTASTSSKYIAANTAQTFSWSANVPTVTQATNYIHVVTLTYSAGVVTAIGLAGGTYVH